MAPRGWAGRGSRPRQGPPKPAPRGAPGRPQQRGAAADAFTCSPPRSAAPRPGEHARPRTHTRGSPTAHCGQPTPAAGTLCPRKLMSPGPPHAAVTRRASRGPAQRCPLTPRGTTSACPLSCRTEASTLPEPQPQPYLTSARTSLPVTPHLGLIPEHTGLPVTLWPGPCMHKPPCDTTPGFTPACKSLPLTPPRPL